MRCSVVVVVHQRYKPLLEAAIRSLSVSSDDEVIVVANDCHLDIEGVRVVECKGNLAHACNQGVSAAQGKYILRVDSDDWVEPELINSLVWHLESRNLDAVWCDYLKADPAGKGEGWESYVISHDPQNEMEHACGVLYRRKIWEELGGYDESLDYQESFDLWGRFKQAGYRSERLSVPLYYYRKHEGSMSTNPEREAVRKALEAKYQ